MDNNTLQILIKARDEASSSLNTVKSGLEGLGAGAMKAGGMLTAGVTAPLVGMAAVGLKAASDLNESTSKNIVTFGAASKAAQDFAETSGKSFGISKVKALEYSATLGVIMQASGLTKQASADMSLQMVKLAADLASFNNISIDVALEKIRAGLVGEAEPLRTVGVLLSEAAVAEKAYATGIAERGAALTDGQKVQARFALIMEQTSTAQGDFARTSEGLANQQRVLSAQFANTSAELGVVLLPILISLAPYLISMLDQVARGIQLFSQMPQPVQAGAMAFLGLVAVMGPLLLVLGSLISAYAQLAAIAPSVIQTTMKLIQVLGPLGLYASLFALGMVIGMNIDKIVEWSGKIPVVGRMLEDLAVKIGLVERATQGQLQAYDDMSVAERGMQNNVEGLKAAYGDQSVVLRKLLDQYAVQSTSTNTSIAETQALGNAIRQIAGRDLQQWLRATKDLTEEQRQSILFTFGMGEAYAKYREEAAKTAEGTAVVATSFAAVKMSAEDTAKGIKSAFASIAPSMDESFAEWDKRLTAMHMAHVNFDKNLTSIYSTLKAAGVQNAREIAQGIGEQGPEAVAAWDRMLVKAPQETVLALQGIRPELESRVGDVSAGVIDQLDQQEAARAQGIANAQAFAAGLTGFLTAGDTFLTMFNAGFSVMATTVEGAKAAAGIQSPSKVTWQMGEDYVQGLINGLIAKSAELGGIARALGATIQAQLLAGMTATGGGALNAASDLVKLALTAIANGVANFSVADVIAKQAQAAALIAKGVAPAEIAKALSGQPYGVPLPALTGVPGSIGMPGDTIIINALDGASVLSIIPELDRHLQQRNRRKLA